MGKHSSSNNLFGNGSGGGRRPVRRRQPTSTRGARPLSAAEAHRAQPVDEGYSLSDPRSRRKGALETAPARLRVERDRRQQRTKRIAIIAASVIGVLLLGGVAGAFAWAKHIEGSMQVVKRREKLIASLEKAEPQKPYNVLLLGADKRKGDTVYRTDTMMLARVDPVSGKVWMISIPRDTHVVIPGRGDAKINEAFAIGGPEGAIEAVKKLTGVKIHHYMQVDFRGFAKAVDALGGVWIDVPVEIDDEKAASIFKTASHIDAGYQRLDGQHALTFVRARHQFADQDFSRMKNQQMFFKAMADQVAKKESIAKLPRVVSSVAPYIKTDMSLMEMIRTAQALKHAGSENVFTTTIPSEWRSPYVWADEEKLEELIDKMKAGESFDGTKTVGAAGEESDAPAKKPSEITVTVRNGAGISGVAKQAASILKAQSFDVGDVGNANQNVYKETLIVYKDDKDAAKLVASALPPGTKIVESRGMYSFDTDILVVIGKDWDLSKVPVTPIKTQ